MGAEENRRAALALLQAENELALVRETLQQAQEEASAAPDEGSSQVRLMQVGCLTDLAELRTMVDVLASRMWAVRVRLGEVFRG